MVAAGVCAVFTVVYRTVRGILGTSGGGAEYVGGGRVVVFDLCGELCVGELDPESEGSGMTLTLAGLQETIEKVRETDPVLKIRVSLRIFEQLQELSGKSESISQNRTLNAVPFEVDPYYRPDWWSEHYRERMVMHLKNGESLEMRQVRPEEKAFEPAGMVDYARDFMMFPRLK